MSLTVLEVEKSKIRLLADSLSSENSLPGLEGHLLAMRTWPFLSHAWGEHPCVSSSFYEGAKPILGGAPLSGHNPNLITSYRAYLLIPSHEGLGLQDMHVDRTPTFSS